ncbi:thiamine phosphate synthase [Bacillus sinesaloumensis]|uniref:thiamine phosphate synthase n=1 Tax=Litchfieldia sinesaloumensis TaxID=1926280 RepID=UPI0009886931|nr:thiamine phosphate synthase [Bacillus sinesaloumensis]
MKLIAVTDDRQSVRAIADKIIAIKDVVDFVQLREKSKSVKEVLTLIEYLVTGGVKKEKLIVNDRLDIALCMDIPSVHLPEHGLPVKLLKQRYPHLRVGCSVHSFEKAKEVEADGADYIIYGHCFETTSKQGLPPHGTGPIEHMKKELTIPVYAIGGITLDNLPTIKAVAADGVALMSSIFSTDQPYSITKKFSEAICDEN